MKKLSIAVMILSLFISACGSSTTSGGSNGAPAPTTEAVKEYIDESQIDAMFSNPNEYKGKHVKLVGRVFGSIEKEKDKVYFQMFADEESNKNTIIRYTGDLNINDDDYVIVDAEVFDEFTGQNAFGGTIKCPRLIAESVEISNYAGTFGKAIKTIEVNETIDQYGYQVTLERIEFSPVDTRAYVKIENNGSDKFGLWEYQSLIIQGKTQYEQESNYHADYPELQSDIRPGIESEGVITFPVLDHNQSLSLHLNGHSSNYDEKIEEYVFEVTNE